MDDRKQYCSREVTRQIIKSRFIDMHKFAHKIIFFGLLLLAGLPVLAQRRGCLRVLFKNWVRIKLTPTSFADTTGFQQCLGMKNCKA
jgi:hypothetical protein